MFDILYCHIGAGKTGTSSIQGTFFRNREPLAAQGIYNFRWPIQNVLSGIVDRTDKLIPLKGPEQQKIDWLERFDHFKGELREAADDTSRPIAFFSTEHCLSLEEADVVRLKEYFAEYARETKILYYARHPLSLIPSNIQQWIKTGHALLPEDPTNMMPRFGRELKNWITVFGKDNIEIRKFEPWNMRDGSAIADICEAIGRPDLYPLLKIHQVNESLSGPATLIADQLNRQLHAGEVGYAQRDYLYGVKGPKYGIDVAVFEKHRAKIDANLAYLEQTFGISLEEPQVKPHTDDRNDMFSDDVLASIARVMNAQQMRIEELEKKLKIEEG
ncbi:MAG: hypothetical protein AAFV27_02940 [Pseudomonadota bacterium]